MFTKTGVLPQPRQANRADRREGLAEDPAPAGANASEEERSRLTQVRAYGLWEQAGKPDGDAARDRFWFEAEKEIMAPQAVHA